MYSTASLDKEVSGPKCVKVEKPCFKKKKGKQIFGNNSIAWESKDYKNVYCVMSHLSTEMSFENSSL